MVRSGLPVPMVAKVTDGFAETSNFTSSKLRMWYGREVWTDPTVPMVAKVSGTCELKNVCAFLHMPLHINITSKMTKEKQ
jgi:hypothetical protein